MQTPEREEPAGYGESEGESGESPTATEIDYTRIESGPTPHAVLNIALKIVGLRIFGQATLPSPVMTVVGGLCSAVAITVILAYIGVKTDYLVALLIVAGVLSIFIVTVTAMLAVFLVRSGWEPGRGKDKDKDAA